MKVINSSEKITAFAGFNFVFKSFKDSGLCELIDKQLGNRGVRSEFSYSDIFSNHMAVYLNGGDCIEDIHTHLRDPLKNIKGMKVCSPDTVLRGIKELATQTGVVENPLTGVKHQFNINSKLNNLLVKGSKVTGLLKENKLYDLDYDNQVIANEKYDAEWTYKSCSGYQPGIASINNIPVYIEGRNGNSQAKYQQEETLTRVFENLSKNKIKINRFRGDSASYQKNVVEVVEVNCNFFYIRANRCANLDHIIGAIPGKSWEKIRLETQEMEVAQINSYLPFKGTKSYRLVITRIKRKDGQMDLFSGQAYTYRAILTNDRESSNQEVVSFYNARGESERLFDVMNNDFGWSKMPFSFLSENTAFMIITAIIGNFYRYLIGVYSKKLSWLEPKFRLKKFIFRFINVAGKWISSGRQDVLKLFTQKDYRPLLT